LVKVNRALPALMSALLLISAQPMAFAADSEPKLNFKIYSPEGPSPVKDEDSAATPAPSTDASALQEETPSEDKMVETPKPVETPTETSAPSTAETPSSEDTTVTKPIESLIDPAVKEESSTSSNATTTTTEIKKPAQKTLLQGFVRVVPTGTKIPIIMDTAVDSDTSQEGDEFAARTSEDLNIDGQITVPAGSIIKGRIARITLPKALNRSGHVALKFDTVTTPDNKQIPIVANLVARGGVVHAKRGMKDIAIDVGAVGVPLGVGLGIGLIAGASQSSSSIGAGGGALIGAGVGAAIGVAILLSKKGKRVDVRPGDELKIELAEELQMPTM
jgi:hypothetical protein